MSNVDGISGIRAKRMVEMFARWLSYRTSIAIDKCGCEPSGHQPPCEVECLLKIGAAWSTIYLESAYPDKE
jgi:hypothetical protein